VHLTLVGGGGDAEPAVRQAATAAGDLVSWRGRVEDRAALRDVYRDHDVFVMPSFTESFGVAYVEALSQGLPIVHARGQGVDGLFPPDTVSEAVQPASPDAIAAGIMRLADRALRVREACVAAARTFDWERIARTYAGRYAEIAR
jgi:glycosyltransferase involved in cell wall biosynthesis